MKSSPSVTVSKSVSDISAFYVADTKGAKVVAGLAVDFPTLTTLALSLKIKLRGMAYRSLDFNGLRNCGSYVILSPRLQTPNNNVYPATCYRAIVQL